jgi:hypothetical protein
MLPTLLLRLFEKAFVLSNSIIFKKVFGSPAKFPEGINNYSEFRA